MKTVANQKIIKIVKEKCGEGNLYTAINLYALQEAMQNLKGEALKLWLYLAKNQNNYSLALSQKDAAEWGIGKDSYYRSISKLEELGYLQKIDNNSNIYTFYEYKE